MLLRERDAERGADGDGGEQVENGFREGSIRCSRGNLVTRFGSEVGGAVHMVQKGQTPCRFSARAQKIP